MERREQTPRVLDRIDLPPDLKGLTLPELGQLAAEIREELIGTVSANGGHLASNLGVVELTLALHRVFNSPTDKIVWDVGHQSYSHKLLTGRKEAFSSIRQYGGLSGFTDREESPHDPFGAGHASTSISAALGMALARDLARERHSVVAIIGDGALTGGMAFEALNHAGHLGTRLIVVLNDNGMAISPNVGALARLLNRVRLDPRYERAKRGARTLVTRLPLGQPAWGLGKRLKNHFKDLVLPAPFWEQLGFEYIGPIDGHDLPELELALGKAREYTLGPALVHVLTQKGKGYPPAEDDCVRFHGVPASIESPNPAPSYSNVFGRTMARLLRENPRVVAITAAMLEGTGLAAVASEFPDRVFDVGICEQHAVTMAAGLAAQGFVPVVAIYSTFLQRAYDQIIHDVCIQNLPVVFALDRSGIVGDDGKTHQGAFDLSYLCAIPNLVVAAPKDENELQHLLYTAVGAGGPVALRYPRGSGYGVEMEEPRPLKIGEGEVLRVGPDLTIIAIGAAVLPALAAAELLSAQGVGATVVNARFAKPLPAETILAPVCQTGRLVTVEENAAAGGFGSSVLRMLAEHGVPVRAELIGLPDEFVEHGPQAVLRAKYDLDAEGIVRRVRRAFPELELALAPAKEGA